MPTKGPLEEVWLEGRLEFLNTLINNPMMILPVTAAAKGINLWGFRTIAVANGIEVGLMMRLL